MTNQISVPFHGTNLIIVEHQNQPFVPMKVIVEGMGLSWGAQAVKLKNNQERWGISLIDIPHVDPNNKVSCLPLRKLFGWLNSLQPSRVRPEIRSKVIQYQNECDDVLYQHWMELTAPKKSPTIDSIITELNLEPNMTRYLVTVDGSGAQMQPMDVTGKSLVDAQAARNLVRDINQMQLRMAEMVRRMGVLDGNCDVKRLDKRID